MKYVNDSQRTLKFVIAGVSYEVEPSGQIEIPDALGYVVKARKYPLAAQAKPVRAEPEAIAEPEAPAKKPKK